ncbi:MAG: hypothetical protein LBT25_11825 [Candidatus Symbiothrix sp.]|jgi:hypothetical protein|nr:hypothetical protein [Candidatus Symbiothrix sp.]
MMNNKYKIEFYKNRDLGERISAATDFLKQNWKVIYKNIFLGAIPLSLISGFALQFYPMFNFAQLGGDVSGFPENMFLAILGYWVVAIIYNTFLFAMTGAVLSEYGAGRLTEQSGWAELKGTMFSFFGKTLLINLILGLSMVIFCVLLVAFVFIVGAGNTALIVLMVFIIILLVIGLTPFFTLAYYPAYYAGKSASESIRIAFGLGFRNWGTTFVVILLSSILMAIVSVVLSMPHSIVSVFMMGSHNFLTFLLASIAAFGTAITVPFMCVFLSFQYFSIKEKEEGVSLQSKVDDFENL